MGIQDNIGTIWGEKEEREDFFRARAALEHATSTVSEELVRFKTIKASGSFATLPQDLKDAMLAWEVIYDDAAAAFNADQNVKDIYAWRPPKP